MSEEKLTKKQRKAQDFRKSKDEKPVKEKKEKKEKEEKKEKTEENVENVEKPVENEDPTKRPLEEGAEDGEPKKKRKTRRGKKGKGINGGKGPRFILFVGNLPYDVTEDTLKQHFKKCNPDRFRIRLDKGIAFLEFDNDTKEIQSKMELALRLHHSLLNKRKINVELTVGGGGNSENRLSKLKEKNSKVLEERRDRIGKEKEKKEEKKEERNQENGLSPTGVPANAVHPARAALMK